MEHLLSPTQVAEHLGVPVKTLYRWRQDSYGPPAIRIGRHLRYRAADLEEFITSRFEEEAASVGTP